MFRESMRGVRVLDFTHVVAGPLCTMTLADLGADVVKIEPPTGEIGRRIGPPWVGGRSAIWLSMNRNKRSVAVDLKQSAGQLMVRRMAQQADVVVESFRPGVMAGFGLDFAALTADNPALVYCSVSAFGQEGPASDRPGVDGIMQAITGLMSTLGERGSGPTKVPVPVADMVTGYLASVAVLAALHEVRNGGRGQHLDVSLYNATILLQQIGFASYFASGADPQRLGSAAPYASPNEAYPTSDGWVMVAAYDPVRWPALCEAVGALGLTADRRFATNDDRVRNRSALREELARLLRSRTTGEWLALLSARDILCAPVNHYSDVVASELFRASGLDRGGRAPGFVLGPSQPVAPADTPPPFPAAHTAEVLAEYGISASEITTLIEGGVVTDADVLRSAAS
jgi:crotonobetainyl-CoA:carnitine CoA-transferase CaiB-like acyl-CoA transferase